MSRLDPERTTAARECLGMALDLLIEDPTRPGLRGFILALVAVVRGDAELARLEVEVAACLRRVLAAGAAGRRN